MSELLHLIRYHRDGFARFTKILDGSADYANNLIAGKAIKGAGSFDNTSLDIAEKRVLAIAENRRSLLSDSLRTIKPRYAGALCYGVTKNNLREFAFLEQQCADIGLKLLQENLFHYPQFVVSPRNEARVAAAALLMRDVENFYNQRTNITAAIVQQQVTYTREFLRYLLAFNAPGAIWPRLMVVANDHYPTQIAISMLMKGAGVPRMYIQHAEVTTAFPDLDFEYSLLRNEVSLNIYQEIGPVPGDVFILSRYRQPFARERLQMQFGAGVGLVIYPSTLAPVPVLADIIKRLKGNPAVGKVYLKLHPNSKLSADDMAALDGAIPTAAAPEDTHVALVGNSSVVTEILHSGVPVYQCFEMDPIQADYYGYVRSGLTQAVSVDELSEVFWTPYRVDEEWLRTFAKLDPSVFEQSTLDHRRMISAITSTIGSEHSKASSGGRKSPQFLTNTLSHISAWVRYFRDGRF